MKPTLDVSPIVRATFLPAIALAFVLASRIRSQPSVADAWTECCMTVALAGVAVYGLCQHRHLLRPRPVSTGWIVAALAAGSLGAAAQSWLLISVAWTAATYLSVERFLSERSRAELKPFWPCLLLIVPWVWADGWYLGYVMRVTGVVVSECGLRLLFENVSREGTTLLVDDVALDVAAACAGLNTLQAFLLVGVFSAACAYRSLAGTFLAIPLALGAAWIANTFRVTALGIIAGAAGSTYVTSQIHDWLGWIILAAVALCAQQLIQSPRREVLS